MFWRFITLSWRFKLTQQKQDVKIILLRRCGLGQDLIKFLDVRLHVFSSVVAVIFDLKIE